MAVREFLIDLPKSGTSTRLGGCVGDDSMELSESGMNDFLS